MQVSKDRVAVVFLVGLGSPAAVVSARHVLSCMSHNFCVCRNAADPMSSMRKPLETHVLGSCHEGAGQRVSPSTSQHSPQHAHTATVDSFKWTALNSFTGSRAASGAREGRTRVLTGGDDAMRRAFREAILEDVVKCGATDDAGLQRLFDRWVGVNPVENRPALVQAIKDVQVRLDAPL